MWFAALGAYQHNPFFISLTYHLLRNNSEGSFDQHLSDTFFDWRFGA